MQFRMGIHMGDVIADEDEVFGDDVNIAVAGGVTAACSSTPS
jgi:class 3 adenylate cyclase